MNNQDKATIVWNDYYKSREEGPLGNLYPNENLIRVVSTIRKGININSETYFGDKGMENKNRTNFHGEVLELGFGHVSNLIMMKEKGFKPFGLEVSEESIKRGRQRLELLNIKNIELDLWVPTKIPFKNEKFNFVYGLQCIYYCLDLDNVISEIFRSLKPGGYFYFSFFSDKHDYFKYSNTIKNGKLFDIVEWSNNHPNTRIRKSPLARVKSKDCLIKLFERASEIRVFTEETDFSPLFNSWWHVYGKK